ncbi:MAG TPA: hypothetical protein PKD00_07025, partial [Burkholderiales bacterium]|nr:hypothetical protein [Burkholderiales bacterium]
EILRLYATIPTVRRTESRENDMQTKALYLIDTAEYYYAKNNFDRALEAIVKAESWREKLETPFVHAERLAQIKQKVNKQIK